MRRPRPHAPAGGPFWRLAQGGIGGPRPGAATQPRMQNPWLPHWQKIAVAKWYRKAKITSIDEER